MQLLVLIISILRIYASFRQTISEETHLGNKVSSLLFEIQCSSSQTLIIAYIQIPHQPIYPPNSLTAIELIHQQLLYVYPTQTYKPWEIKCLRELNQSSNLFYHWGRYQDKIKILLNHGRHQGTKKLDNIINFVYCLLLSLNCLRSFVPSPTYLLLLLTITRKIERSIKQGLCMDKLFNYWSWDKANCI